MLEEGEVNGCSQSESAMPSVYLHSNGCLAKVRIMWADDPSSRSVDGYGLQCFCSSNWNERVRAEAKVSGPSDYCCGTSWGYLELSKLQRTSESFSRRPRMVPRHLQPGRLARPRGFTCLHSNFRQRSTFQLLLPASFLSMESLLSLSFDYLSSYDGVKVRKGLRQLEGLLAQICLSRSNPGHQDRRHSIAVTGNGANGAKPPPKDLGQLRDDPAFREFFKLQEGFEWNGSSLWAPPPKPPFKRRHRAGGTQTKLRACE